MGKERFVKRRKRERNRRSNEKRKTKAAVEVAKMKVQTSKHEEIILKTIDMKDWKLKLEAGIHKTRSKKTHKSGAQEEWPKNERIGRED